MTASAKPRVEFRSIVLDCPDPKALAEFYAELMELPAPEIPDDEWAIVRIPTGGRICFQLDPEYQPPTWPEGPRPQMFHLDLTVADLDAEHERTIALGARSLTEVVGNGDDKWRVYADPAGHPFCLCA